MIQGVSLPLEVESVVLGGTVLITLGDLATEDVGAVDGSAVDVGALELVRRVDVLGAL